MLMSHQRLTARRSRSRARRLAPFVLAVAFASAAGSRGAFADPTPQPQATAPAPSVPSLPIPSALLNSPYVQGVLNALGGLTQTTTGPTAVGKVTYFKQFELQLETAPNVYRKIHLHQGTVINPRGTTLQPGMSLSVNGSPQNDGSLNADTITLR
jgi:hypothetical protein